MDYRLLGKLNHSALKGLSYNECSLLAAEIRHEMVNVVTKNGGHLASNLGVVELTIALHRVFDCPKDRFIFDVSHQCYVHKLLTDRYDRFDNGRNLARSRHCKKNAKGYAQLQEPRCKMERYSPELSLYRYDQRLRRLRLLRYQPPLALYRRRLHRLKGCRVYLYLGSRSRIRNAYQRASYVPLRIAYQ